jgi:hypothetical protein
VTYVGDALGPYFPAVSPVESEKSTAADYVLSQKSPLATKSGNISRKRRRNYGFFDYRYSDRQGGRQQ